MSERELGDLGKLMEGDSQLADHMRMVGQKVDVDGQKVNLEKVEYVFVNPKGGAANLEALWKLLPNRPLSVKLFRADGTDVVFDAQSVRILQVEDRAFRRRTSKPGSAASWRFNSGCLISDIYRRKRCSR